MTYLGITFLVVVILSIFIIIWVETDKRFKPKVH
jgi:hypothetical protein